MKFKFTFINFQKILSTQQKNNQCAIKYKLSLITISHAINSGFLSTFVIKAYYMKQRCISQFIVKIIFQKEIQILRPQDSTIPWRHFKHNLNGPQLPFIERNTKKAILEFGLKKCELMYIDLGSGTEVGVGVVG